MHIIKEKSKIMVNMSGDMSNMAVRPFLLRIIIFCSCNLLKSCAYMVLGPVFQILNKMIVLSGLACLHLAALNRQHQIIRLLLKKNADLNIQVCLQLTAMHPLYYIFL